MVVRTFLGGIALAGLAVALPGCGDAGSDVADDATPTGSACPSFAAVEDAEGADGVYQQFIVGLDPPLQDDADARAELLERVGEQLCLGITETSTLSSGSALVDVGRPLDAAGQARVVAAFEKLDGVAYAAPDAVMTIDGGTAE